MRTADSIMPVRPSLNRVGHELAVRVAAGQITAGAIFGSNYPHRTKHYQITLKVP